MVDLPDPIETTVELRAGEEHHVRLSLKKGIRVRYTCLARRRFYCGFYSREEYVRKRSAGVLGAFGFIVGSDKREDSRTVSIIEDDDYYLVLRCPALSDPVKVEVRIQFLPSA